MGPPDWVCVCVVRGCVACLEWCVRVCNFMICVRRIGVGVGWLVGLLVLRADYINQNIRHLYKKVDSYVIHIYIMHQIRESVTPPTYAMVQW